MFVLRIIIDSLPRYVSILQEESFPCVAVTAYYLFIYSDLVVERTERIEGIYIYIYLNPFS